MFSPSAAPATTALAAFTGDRACAAADATAAPATATPAPPVRPRQAQRSQRRRRRRPEVAVAVAVVVGTVSVIATRRRQPTRKRLRIVLVEAGPAIILACSGDEVVGGKGLQRMDHGEPPRLGQRRRITRGAGASGGERVEQLVDQHRGRQRAAVAHAANQDRCSTSRADRIRSRKRLRSSSRRWRSPACR